MGEEWSPCGSCVMYTLPVHRCGGCGGGGVVMHPVVDV